MSGQSVETLELVVDREHNGGETFLEFVASLSRGTRLFKKYGQARDFLWETPDGRIRVHELLFPKIFWIIPSIYSFLYFDH